MKSLKAKVIWFSDIVVMIYINIYLEHIDEGRVHLNAPFIRKPFL